MGIKEDNDLKEWIEEHYQRLKQETANWPDWMKNHKGQRKQKPSQKEIRLDKDKEVS